MCVRVTWNRGLNVRPLPSLYAPAFAYIYPNVVVEITRKVDVTEIIGGKPFAETWAQVNDGWNFAMKVGDRIYAEDTPCP
jgi:hypothetical protein